MLTFLFTLVLMSTYFFFLLQFSLVSKPDRSPNLDLVDLNGLTKSITRYSHVVLLATDLYRFLFYHFLYSSLFFITIAMWVGGVCWIVKKSIPRKQKPDHPSNLSVAVFPPQTGCYLFFSLTLYPFVRFFFKPFL